MNPVDSVAPGGDGRPSADARIPFPHPVYAETILAPAFASAARWLFVPMLECSEAHLLMLVDRGLMPREQAARVWTALETIQAEGPSGFTYAPEVEDLFFQVEARVSALAGEVAGGNLHIARSRNDLDAGMARLTVRRLLLEAHAALEELRGAVLARVLEHVEALMPGHTHTQPAQPTTLGHYLAATAEALERDAARLQAAYARTNRSPLGAAALTTTGFPIDRALTGRLLGFDAIVTNSYDAIGGVDYALESLAALTTCALGLSRLLHDLLQWATREFGVLQVDESFLQISSIMPQKRNPVVLEHLRARVGYVVGDAATAQAMVHSAALGDTVDVEDAFYVPLFRAFEHATAFLRLFAAALSTCRFDARLLAARASDGFTTATELADTLVRQGGLPFRQAHRVTSALVRRSGGDPRRVTPDAISAVCTELLGTPVQLSAEEVQQALDPWAFVLARTIPGGPAPAAVSEHARAMRVALQRDAAWREVRQSSIAEARAERRRRARALQPALGS